MLVLLLVCITIASIVIACRIVYKMRKRVVAMTVLLENIIQEMVTDTFHNDATLYSETITGKIGVRLKRLYDALVQQREISQEHSQQIQILISDISHQVKTPLANIKLLNETILDEMPPSTNQEKLHQQLDMQIDKLEQLLNVLLKTSRLEVGSIVLAPASTLLITTIANAVGLVSIFAESKQIEIQVDCSSNLSVFHDEKWTSEALFNVLDNAIKYSPNNSVVAIQCEKWEMYTRISVLDNGMGISETEQAQIFQRFYRSPMVQDIEGAGIGLFLTQEIIQKQGGYVKVTSVVGQGTKMDLFLRNEKY